MVHKFDNYKVFNSLDLKCTHHQILVLEQLKIFTAFETKNKLYQFTRLAFGSWNAVAAFQRKMENFIVKNLSIYLDI